MMQPIRQVRRPGAVGHMVRRSRRWGPGIAYDRGPRLGSRLVEMAEVGVPFAPSRGREWYLGSRCSSMSVPVCLSGDIISTLIRELEGIYIGRGTYSFPPPALSHQ